MLPLVVVFCILISTGGHCSCSVVEKTFGLGFGTSLGLSIDENLDRRDLKKKILPKTKQIKTIYPTSNI
jgi:hypothetical protein